MDRTQFFTSKLYPKIFLNSEKTTKIFSIEKKFRFFSMIFFFAKNRTKNRKFQIFEKINFFENLKFSIFGPIFREKKIVEKKTRKISDFFGVEKFFGYSFDVKFPELLIYDTSRSIRARQTRFLARQRCVARSEKTCIF